MSPDHNLRPVGEHVELDSERHEFDYGKGGVPWLLLLFYTSFLVFFTWYVLEYQLPDFLSQSPIESSDATSK
jgi:hypothetical protein